MTDPTWSPIARRRAHEQVMDRIEEQILTGTLQVGDLLPPERELAALLQVSRPAVREAVRGLEVAGVVTAGTGSGHDAGTRVSGLPDGALTRILRLHVALANFPLADVVDVRVTLEQSSATLAARHATDPGLAAIRTPLLDMDQTDQCDAFNELDTQFHIAIAEAAGNRLLAAMTTAIRESTRLPILAGMEALGTAWPSFRERLRSDHHRIYDAIAGGRGDEASDLLGAHIRNAHHTLSETR